MAHKDLTYRNTLSFILNVLDEDHTITEFSVNNLVMLRCEETAHIAATLIRRNGQRAEVYVIYPMFSDRSKLFPVLASAFEKLPHL